MDDTFDPYRKWLGIPPAEQPPNHYRLLGVPLFEDDAETISHAADQRIAYVRTLALGDFADLSQRVLNELAAAKVCLLNRAKKAAYDVQLRARTPPAINPAIQTASVPPRPMHLPAVRMIVPPIVATVPLPTDAAPIPAISPPPATTIVQPDDEISTSRAGAGYARRLRAKSIFLRRAVAAFAMCIMIGLIAWVAWRNSGTRGTPDKTLADLERREAATPKAKPTPAVARAPFARNQAQRHQKAWARYLGRQVVATNSIGMKLVLIPPGEFLMGEDQTQHQVRILKPFIIGAYEVTIEQFQRFIEDIEYPEGEKPVNWKGPWKHDDQAPDCPVQNVNWFDAVLFCNWLSVREGRQPCYAKTGEKQELKWGGDTGAECKVDVLRCDFASDGYRLPTDSEWEYTCRAGTNTLFHFGNVLNGRQANCDGNLPQGTSERGPSLGRTTRIGSYQANAWEICDMHGNVREWCWDWFDALPAGAASDPTGPVTGDGRVSRGGAFGFTALDCRCAFRYGVQPVIREGGFGFRVSTTVTPGVSGRSAPPFATAPFSAERAKHHQEAWANYLKQPGVETNSVGMKLALIPPGEFEMGSPSSEEGRQDAELQHLVRITKAFYMGVHEVTQKEYQDVMGINPSHFSSGGPAKDTVQGMDTSEHPVESVSWLDSVDYCNKLSEREKRSPYYVRDGESVNVLGGTGYRLPTEAEWEYACRAGTTTRWSFGDNEQDLAHHAWIRSNEGNGTHRVEGLAANPFGLYDLHGNVWEWCWDWSGAYGKSVDGAVDPIGAESGPGRVIRGGGWTFVSADSRSATRGGGLRPPDRNSDLGFRVAVVLSSRTSE